ncbi:hypothetical protein, partial [Enterococcus faecium]|uniref:hypothetical protein n=1 Tax=Enterococcus faecium TaxID=1352 RepID=UPI003F51D95A
VGLRHYSGGRQSERDRKNSRHEVAVFHFHSSSVTAPSLGRPSFTLPALDPVARVAEGKQSSHDYARGHVGAVVKFPDGKQNASFA